mmetsp:Transcript_22662/g.49519  ORF Transcript_22662/g.49519 Transcript_22662/m.49519 type:complete len:507 (-) Transcript_22662:31-1551(-)
MASLPSASDEGRSYFDAAIVGPALHYEFPGQTLQEMHGQLLVVTNEYSGVGQPNIQREVELITRALSESSLIKVRKAALGDLALALTQHDDAIVAAHFAGHGLSEGFVLNRLCSPEGHYVLERYLHADIFKDCTQLHCAFFNACWSDNVAASFQECPAFSELYYTISVPGMLSDEIAYAFAGEFYGRLAKRGNVEEAFTQGHELIEKMLFTLGHDLEARPQLWIRPGTPVPRSALRIGPPRRALQFQVQLAMKEIRERENYADDIKDYIIDALEAFQLIVMKDHIQVVKRKTRWELRLDNSLDIRTTEEQAQALKERMEQAFPDDGIFFVFGRLGSLILCFCSSFGTFQKMQARQDSGDLSAVLGMPVLSLSQVGVDADIVVPGYVYARLCAYRTACPEEDVAMQIGMPTALPGAEQPSTGDLPAPAASATQSSPIPSDATKALAFDGSPGSNSDALPDDTREALQVEQAALAMKEHAPDTSFARAPKTVHFSAMSSPWPPAIAPP